MTGRTGFLHRMGRVVRSFSPGSAIEPKPADQGPVDVNAYVAGAVWRGGLDGMAVGPDGEHVPAMDNKYRDELAYWKHFVDEGARAEYGHDFEPLYTGWQGVRIDELARFLDLPDREALQRWASTRTAIEIGAGPFPSISLLRWKRAVAVDPIADGYAAEGLLPSTCADVTYLASAGEHVPLPGGMADVVVLENCLDHVSRPGRVLAEVNRLLRDGGLLWLLVDLMDYRDHLHPNPFSLNDLRKLLGEHGFEAVRERVDDHKCHPHAYGEYRGLLRKAVRPSAGVPGERGGVTAGS